MEYLMDSRRRIKPKTMTPYSLYYYILSILHVELLSQFIYLYILEVKLYLIPNLKLQGLISLPVYYFLLELLGYYYYGLHVLSYVAELTYNIVYYLDK